MALDFKDDHHQSLTQTSPWVKLDGIDWTCLTKGLMPKKYKKNSIVFYQGCFSDYVYLVKKGRVHLDIYSQNGEEKTLFIAVEGSLIGEVSPIDGLPNICSAAAATDSFLYLIPKEAFFHELKTNNQLALNVLLLATRKIRCLAEDIKQTTFHNPYYRVCHALIHLANQYSAKLEQGHKLNIKFTHQEMANLTGLSRVSISNVISAMGTQGILTKEDGYLIIKRFDLVRQHVETHT